ncbi:MAG TPA: hypothetical protein VN736_29675 [Candidatus Limnocylindrales bacterium]|nr:hypothetical protein [Candidatus Limnocylindrales bacterium]
MALILAGAPAGTFSAYAIALQDFGLPEPPQDATFFLPVRSLCLEELAMAAPLSDAIPAGARFVASWPNGSVASCEMNGDELRSIVQGDDARILLNAMHLVLSLDAVRQRDYEVYLLSMPGAQREALCLVPVQGGSTLIAPVGEADILTEATFIQQNAAIARRRLSLTCSERVCS